MRSDRLKAYFIPIYMVLTMLIGAASVVMLVFSPDKLAWFGAMLTVLPFLQLYVQTTFIKAIPRTSRRLPVHTSLSVAGLLLAGFVTARDAINPTAFVVAVIGCIGFLLYIFWYSEYGKRLSEKLRVGNMLPDFDVCDENGGSANSANLRGQPALYMFYRGNWCPFCTSQVGELVGRYRQLIDRGVQVALISSQPQEFTKRVADTFGVAFHFWVDTDNHAAEILDIAHRDGVPTVLRKKFGSDTVLPTVVITDANGRIIFTDQADNYRVRPSPDRFFRALSAAGL